MFEQKSKVAQLLHQINLDGTAARGLVNLSAGSAKHSSINARLEQTEAYKQLTGTITTLSRYCKKRLSLVLYNIDVVKCTQNQRVSDAV